MRILGEITLSSEADYETEFLYSLPRSLIPLLYRLSNLVCFLLQSSLCAAEFFPKGFIYTVLSTQSLIAVTVAAI